MALTDNLIAYYKFDETSGTNVDDATGGTDATADAGATVNSTGKLSYCRDFSSGKVSMPVLASLGNCTINLWVNPDNVGGGGTTRTMYEYRQAATSHRLNISFNDVSGGYVFVILERGGSAYKTIRSNGTVSTGSWQMITVTKTGETIQIFINGVSQTITTLNDVGDTSGALSSTATPTIGNSADGGSSPFDGKIDEFGMWSRVLTSDEVTQLYNSGNGLAYPLSIGWAKKIFGVTPAKVNNIAKSSISRINGV